MKICAILPIIFIFFSCSDGDSKFIRKKIEDGSITIKWYYYSYISNNSPDYVEIDNNGNKKEIYKATWVITDVQVSGKNIILKLAEPSKGIVYTSKVDNEVYGYKIIVDTTASIESLMRIPDGIKEN